MKIEKIIKDGVEIALVSTDGTIIADPQSALDVMMTVKYQTGTANAVFPKHAFTESFFILSSGLAGEILQKFINYKFRVAIYGDFSVYASKPLKDFIYESNRGRDIFFTDSAESAVQKLCRK